MRILTEQLPYNALSSRIFSKNHQKMAKLNGIIGSGSGKVGVMVLSKGKAGQTIARAYQPQVANPNTIPQQLVRAKMSLAGKIRKIVPTAALSALSMGNNRANQSEFSRVIIRSSTAGLVGGIPTAQVNPNRIVFGKGAAPMLASLGTAVFAKNSISIPVTATPGSYDGVYGVRIIALCAKSAETPTLYEFCSYTDHLFAKVAEGQTSVTDTIVVTTPDMATGNQIMLYVVPFVMSERGLKAFGNVLDYSDSLLTASLSVNSGFVTDWGNSYFGGVVPFVAA